jgi:hypothetical protein
MDFITGLPPPPDSNGRVYDAVLAVVEMFSKFTVVVISGELTSKGEN